MTIKMKLLTSHDWNFDSCLSKLWRKPFSIPWAPSLQFFYELIEWHLINDKQLQAKCSKFYYHSVRLFDEVKKRKIMDRTVTEIDEFYGNADPKGLALSWWERRERILFFCSKVFKILSPNWCNTNAKCSPVFHFFHVYK